MVIIIQHQSIQMVSSHLMLDYSPHLVIQNGLTALGLASFSNHHEIVECLLRAGANPDLQDEVRMEESKEPY